MQTVHYNSLNLDIVQTREEIPAPARHPLHAHEYYEVCWFKEGKGVYHIEGNEYPLEPGDLVLIRPREAHYVEVDPGQPFERILFSFGATLLRTLDPDESFQAPLQLPQPGTQNLYPFREFPQLHGPLETMLIPNSSRGDILIGLIRFLQLLNEAYIQAPPMYEQKETVERRIIRLINDNYHLELSLQELCDQFYISRAQLCRRFKKATGSSIGKYIMLKRMDAAQRLIVQGRKLSEVCSLCGFQDYSTFYRTYTRHFGRSPKKGTIPREKETK